MLCHASDFPDTLSTSNNKLTRWCHCRSLRGTRLCAGRKVGVIQGPSGSSELGQNTPRYLPRSASHLHCIPAQAGLDTVSGSSVKPQSNSEYLTTDGNLAKGRVSAVHHHVEQLWKQYLLVRKEPVEINLYNVSSSFETETCEKYQIKCVH